MNPSNSESIGHFFDHKWHLYQQVISRNVLCHSEMFVTLDQFLNERYGKTPFSFADFGCGDGTAVRDTLLDKPVTHYVGVDAACDLLSKVTDNLASLKCEKTLICKDIATAVLDLKFSVDVIFCSYVLHHLLFEQKLEFIENCYAHTKTPGYLVIVDGVAMDGETREHWLDRLERRILENVPDFTTDDRNEIMKHPREADYPETLTTFREFASVTSWKSFEVLLERDNFLAFLVLSK